MTGIKLTLILQLVTILIKCTSSQDLLSINTKKVVALTSDKFLSLTFDPAILLNGDVFKSSTEQSTNMAKGLAPGYVRLAGPRSNTYTFERSLFPQSGYEDPNLTFSEAHWVLVQQWAQKAGLDVVSCLTPQRIENEDQVTAWDPRNSLDLISFSDHMGYNISWQLGYECQTRCDVSGSDLGKDIVRLRNMLGAFPRYSNTIIAGPDVVSFRSKQQQQFIQDYLNAAGNSLSVITWHPDFASIALDNDGVSLQTDTLAADRDLLYKAMGRAVSKKPLWIAESQPEECKRQFLGALVWGRRLGNAAKLGVQVIMRQPDASSILQPTPDYWVSLLHKMLVGREVLDAKLTSGNKTHVHFYCQCTKPSAKYDKGAITIFGLNLTPNKISVALKGLKVKAVHKYILMPGYDAENRMFAETVLLNNAPLNLVDGKTLPEINPAVSLMGKNMAIKLPSGGIGFWVIPGARVKSCMGHDEDMGDRNLLKKWTKKLEEPEVADENLGHEEEDNQDLESESTEDIRSLLKSKMKKRKYKQDTETEDEERRFKRIDAKKELEKLEKLFKRNNEDRKSSNTRGKVGLTMFESGVNNNAVENKESSEEDEGLMRLTNEKIDSAEEIRSKLEEYKKKLSEYENKKRNDEESLNNRHEHLEQMQEASSKLNRYSSSEIDKQKAIEALALISKVEGAMQDHGSSNEKIKYHADPRNKLPLDPKSLVEDLGENILIEELEKTDKNKRMIDPRSLNKFYQFLMSNIQPKEVHKRDVRDLEKLLGDDPLGLRKEGLFKKRLKNDEIRERRLERRNRKKDKEEIGLKKELKKELLTTRFDPKVIDSNENNFFGFPEMKPIENFPEGDLHLTEGTSSEEKDGDYDYVKDDDDDELVDKRKRKKHQKAKPKKQNDPAPDEPWIEEPNSNLYHAPHEFFERLNTPTMPIKTQWKDYGELWEPESLQQKNFKEEQKKIAVQNDTVVDTVITREQLDEREDKRAKETAVKKLINYYDNSEGLKSEQNFGGNGKQHVKERENEPKLKFRVPVQSKIRDSSKSKLEPIPKQNTKRLLELDNEYEDSAEVGSMQFVSSKAADYSEEVYNDEDYIASEFTAKKRPKRKISNIDTDMFDKEMIREDAGNLKDCKCRVIRNTGRLRCKNCKKAQRRVREVSESIPPEQNPTIIDSTTEELPVNASDKEEISDQLIEHEVNPLGIPEVSQDAAAASKGEEAIPIALNDEVSSVNVVQPLKNTELDDLNESTNRYMDTTISSTTAFIDNTPSSDTANAEFSITDPTVSTDNKNLRTNESDSQSITVTEADEFVDKSSVESQAVSDTIEGEVEMEKSSDDTVGSQRLYNGNENSDDGPTDQQSIDEPIVNKKDLTKPAEEFELEKKLIDTENNYDAGVSDDNYAKRHISENAEVNSNTEMGTKISLSTGTNVEKSAKTDIVGSKLKDKIVEMKLKSESKSGLKSELSKNKFVLNTEALSALVKENENKRAEVMKALESSKLKSVDNTKYVEYQKKRAEKLAILKEKLKERKAKILQQYRQELLDALSKCDDEVEKNLKRREIWEDFTKEDEFQDFIDKDKLAYLMMNRPVNYENTEEQNDEIESEDRRYYPEVSVVQPLPKTRAPKITVREYRRNFYEPRSTYRFETSEIPSSQESFDHRDMKNQDQYGIKDLESAEHYYGNDDSYYAIVDSLENPKIFNRQQLEDLQYSGNNYDGYNTKYRNDEPIFNSDDEEYLQHEKSKFTTYSESIGDSKEIYNRQRPMCDRGNCFSQDHHRQPLQPIYEIENSAYHQGEPVALIYDENSGEENVPQELITEKQYAEHRNMANKLKTYSKGIENDSLKYFRNTEDVKKFHDVNDDLALEFNGPKRFTFDVNVNNDQEELYGNEIQEIPVVDDEYKILHKLNSPRDDESGESIQELTELQSNDEITRENFDSLTPELNFLKKPLEKQLSRNERHLSPSDKQLVQEPAYKVMQLDQLHDSSVKKEKEVREKRSNYICLRDDSREDVEEDESRLFKLVKNEDHYDAVPITQPQEEISPKKQRTNHRRVARYNEKMINKKRKNDLNALVDENADYDVRNGRHRSHGKEHFEKRRFIEQNNEGLLPEDILGNYKRKYKYDAKGKSHLINDGVDYHLTRGEINRLDADPRLNPEEYDVLMLIPVKKQVKRQRREISDNEIDRSGSYEDMNKMWDDIVEEKNNENLLEKYIEEKDKIVRDFEEAQNNLNKYLRKLESMKDPLQLDKFKRIILNLESPDRDEIAIATKTQDEIDAIHLREYLKKEILKKIDGVGEKFEEPTTSAPETSTSSTFFDIIVPKLENTISDELEKVGNLTESLEDFINEFDNRFNNTSEPKSSETANETPNKNNKVSYNIFHKALENVKKFFDFLSGVSLVFRRH